MRMIIEKDDGSREEFTNFFAVGAIDKSESAGGEIHKYFSYEDCRILVVGGLLKKTWIYADIEWDKFITENFDAPWIDAPDMEALEGRITRGQN